MFNLKKFLPDLYNKENDTNTHKLFKIIELTLIDYKELCDKFELWRSAEKAEGKVLDEIGENLGQSRGFTTDKVYRVLIRGKIERSKSDGSINRMLRSLSKSLNCSPNDISIKSEREVKKDGEVAAIVIDRLPLEALSETGLSMQGFANIAQSLTAASVKLKYVNFEGTFAFSDNDEVMENQEFGFSNVEMKIGGTLSGILKQDEERPLPIG